MSPSTRDRGGRRGRRRRAERRVRLSSLPRRLRYAAEDAGHALKRTGTRVGDAWRDGAGGRRRLARRLAEGANRGAEEGATALRRLAERGSVAAASLLSLAGQALARGVERTAAVVTPVRTMAVVTGLAAVALGISQFVDYRGVEVGVTGYEAYSDVESVAPPPQVDRAPAGSAHGYVLVPVALVVLGALFLCLRGRWQAGRAIWLAGLFTIAISLVVDAPAGLDAGEQAVLYEGTEATLIEGFWVQLSAGITLVIGGVLVSRRAAASRVSRSRVVARRRDTASSGLQGTA